MKIKAAVVREKGKFALEELELGAPRMGEVLVKMVASGLCHTDTTVLNQDLPTPLPMVLGHEGVGIVEEVGPGVLGLKPGDHVIMSFPSCGCCEPCQDGRPYACDRSTELFFFGGYADGDRRITDGEGAKVGALFGQGSLATYAICAERSAIKVDPEADMKDLCSLACGAQTGAGVVLNKQRPRPGDTYAVFGCGAVGFSAIMAAKLSGCSTIIAVDVVPSRLELALECGATHIINGRECEDVPAEIKRLTGGKGVHFALEAAGLGILVKQMVRSMRPDGFAMVVSFAGDVPLNAGMDLVGSCVTLGGTVEGAANPPVFIPRLVQYYKEGRFPVDKLSRYYKLEELDKALEESHNGSAIKPIIVF